MKRSQLRSVLSLDGVLLRRVVDAQRLGPVLLTSLAILAVGCGAYGFAMGLWRSPLQAVSGAIKLPLMFLATAALTAALDVVLSGLLRARIAPLQALTASVLAMAILGSILGSLAPVAAFVSMQVGPPEGAQSVPTSHWLLTGHVLIMGGAGIVAVARLRGLLDALIADAAVSRRVLWSWMLTHGIVGAQLSWVLRPFVGNPTLPVRVFRERAWEGSFFEAVYDMTVALMGLGGPVSVILLLFGVVVAAMVHLDQPVERFEIRADVLALRRRDARSDFLIPLSAIRAVSMQRGQVRVDWQRPGDLELSSVELPPTEPREAQVVLEQLSWATRSAGGYRTPGGGGRASSTLG
ncbi:MAG: hypothetical protein ACRBN8_36635 [Nannocystales bacterium]